MKQITIGLPCTPSHIVKNKLINVTQILITYGGGMGGSNKTYYFTKQRKMADGLIELTLFNGKKVQVNPTFIVSKEKCNILKLETDITAHCNYHSNKLGKDRQIRVEYIYLDEEETFTLTNSYTARHEGELKNRVILVESVLVK